MRFEDRVVWPSPPPSPGGRGCLAPTDVSRLLGNRTQEQRVVTVPSGAGWLGSARRADGCTPLAPVSLRKLCLRRLRATSLTQAGVERGPTRRYAPCWASYDLASSSNRSASSASGNHRPRSMTPTRSEALRTLRIGRAGARPCSEATVLHDELGGTLVVPDGRGAQYQPNSQAQGVDPGIFHEGREGNTVLPPGEPPD